MAMPNAMKKAADTSDYGQFIESLLQQMMQK
jgi:hypothetical protein